MVRTVEQLVDWCARNNVPLSTQLMVFDFVEDNYTFAVLDEHDSSPCGIRLGIDTNVGGATGEISC